MANKDFKVKNGIDIQTPLPVTMGGTGQTSTTNTLNSLLPAQAGNTDKVLQTDGTNTTWYTIPAAYNRGNTASRPGSPTAGDLYFNTDYNYFEQYTALGWFPIAAAPGTPTGVTATDQGSGRAYNNGQMSLAFTPNTSAGYPSSFIVTPSPSTSPTTFTGTSSPVTVTGLASSTQYTYTVQATSAYGTSSASTASSGVTATTVPQAPSLTAASGNTDATITITPGATGGSAITQYSITSNPSTTTQTTSNTTYTFTGLTNGTAYTFTATATNANGTSAASAASNSVTPTAIESSMEPIAVATVPSGGLSSITFDSIPQTYTNLQLRYFGGNNGNPGGSGFFSFNGDTTSANYYDHVLYGNGAGIFAGADAGGRYLPYNLGDVNKWGVNITDILDYTNTNKYKVARSLGGYDNNGSGYVIFASNLWKSTAAINSITITTNQSFVQYSSFALYGIKGA